MGMLPFATKVVWPGRSFLRRLYAIQQIGKFLSHHIRLNTARANIMVVFFHAQMEQDFNSVESSKAILRPVSILRFVGLTVLQTDSKRSP